MRHCKAVEKGPIHFGNGSLLHVRPPEGKKMAPVCGDSGCKPSYFPFFPFGLFSCLLVCVGGGANHFRRSLIFLLNWKITAHHLVHQRAATSAVS